MDNSISAFACASNEGYQEGMTLRDYFAGQALNGLLAYPNRELGKFNPERAAKYSYEYADAMIAEREKTR